MAAIQLDANLIIVALISAGPAYFAIRRSGQAKKASESISSQMVEGFRGSRSAVEELKTVIAELRIENQRLRDVAALDRKIWAQEKQDLLNQIASLRNQLEDLDKRVRGTLHK